MIVNLFFSVLSGFSLFELFFCKKIFGASGTTRESSPLVPTRCLLFLATNGNLTLVELFFCKKIPLSRRVGYVMDGSMGQ